ncbi:hypothetical protein BDN67DRAFT_979621 [Paxillus ammoniavirescens]|nr:hypothetical protein BDN67DRAFT_979621 [Paxillus ammoniavirescens]
MARLALVAALMALSFSSGVNAMCYACPNCDYDNISTTQGNACLNYWTCSASVITCYYPSVEDPGTFSACEFTGTQTEYGYYEFALTSGPSVCDGLEIGDNSKCEPSNDPWNAVSNECTGSEAYVGEPNSGLLRSMERVSSWLTGLGMQVPRLDVPERHLVGLITARDHFA